MLVESTDGNSALLGRPKKLRPGVLTCLSGFIEQGESVEEAVAREVKEEAGVSLAAIQLLGSQPWPIGALEPGRCCSCCLPVLDPQIPGAVASWDLNPVLQEALICKPWPASVLCSGFPHAYFMVPWSNSFLAPSAGPDGAWTLCAVPAAAMKRTAERSRLHVTRVVSQLQWGLVAIIQGVVQRLLLQHAQAQTTLSGPRRSCWQLLHAAWKTALTSTGCMSPAVLSSSGGARGAAGVMGRSIADRGWVQGVPAAASS